MPERLFHTIRLHIFGRVQGVFFRESMRQTALALGLRGWVRNRRDGSVEAVIHGEAGALTAMRDWARHGPPLAQVTRVEETPDQGEFTDFERRPTY